jgi:hypothetical protein
MVLDAPPAPTLPPELLWPSNGGSGNDWGGHDGGEGGGGGWWSEDPDEWEANGEAAYHHSRARRALSLFTVLVLALASVGGFLLLLIGGASGAPLSSHVVFVEPVPASAQSPASEQVAFTVTNTATMASGARCVVSVFGGGNELGSATVATQEPMAVGMTERGSALVSLGHSTSATSATVACQEASVVVSK